MQCSFLFNIESPTIFYRLFFNSLFLLWMIFFYRAIVGYIFTDFYFCFEYKTVSFSLIVLRQDHMCTTKLFIATTPGGDEFLKFESMCVYRPLMPRARRFVVAFSWLVLNSLLNREQNIVNLKVPSFTVSEYINYKCAPPSGLHWYSGEPTWCKMLGVQINGSQDRHVDVLLTEKSTFLMLLLSGPTVST